MKITTGKWSELRRAIEADDAAEFENLVTEFVRIAVASERSFVIRCDRVRSFEQGRRPWPAQR